MSFDAFMGNGICYPTLKHCLGPLRMTAGQRVSTAARLHALTRAERQVAVRARLPGRLLQVWRHALPELNLQTGVLRFFSCSLTL